MSLENQGFFQLLKEVTFRRILVFYNSRKWGRFRGICTWSDASGWLIGLVQRFSINFQEYVVNTIDKLR